MTDLDQKKETMREQKKGEQYTTLVSKSFAVIDEECLFETAFRRWLVEEIEGGKITVAEAVERFGFSPKSGSHLIRRWRKKYAPEMVLSLPAMTTEEKEKFKQLQERNKQLEKQLQDAAMKNIALNTLIDIAEEKLKISIRKKPGAKQ